MIYREFPCACLSIQMYSTSQAVPDKMKAMVYDKSGPNRMAWQSDHPVPTPGRKEVLVKVASSSINVIDYRLTDHRGLLAVTPKRVVGCDFAGTVVALGREVRGFAVGDQVFGWGSGYANYCTANLNEIARVPAGHDVDEFGIYGLVGTCAHQVLRKHWFDRPNFNVRSLLVIGASGGVGSSVVQIARAMGGPEIRIFGVCSFKNSDYVREIGANEAVDYTVRDFDIARAFPVHSMDLIVDTVSGTPESTDYYHAGGALLLKPHGRYVALNSLSGLDWTRTALTAGCGCDWQKRNYDLFATSRKRSDVDLQAVARLAEQGNFKLNVAEEIPLLETPIRRALHNLRLRHIRGKVKIRPTEFGAQEQPPFQSPTASTSQRQVATEQGGARREETDM